jgi:site-specific recombinase XerD
LSPRITTGPQALVEEYLTWKASYRKPAAKAYRIWVERFQNFVEKAPEELELSDVTTFIAMVQQTYSPKNVEYGMSIIHNYLRFWKELGRLAIPLFLVKIPTAIATSHNAITEEEYQKMLRAIQAAGIVSLRNRCIIRLLHDTGMRVGELCALNLEDLEQETAVIRTEKTIRERRIFWTSETERVVREYAQARKAVKTQEPSALFVGLQGNVAGRLTTRSVQRIVERMTQSAEIGREICPHSFRHGFIHRAALKGVPDSVISVLVGHSTPETVAHYTKLSRPEFQETYRKIFGSNEWGRGVVVDQPTTAIA